MIWLSQKGTERVSSGSGHGCQSIKTAHLHIDHHALLAPTSSANEKVSNPRPRLADTNRALQPYSHYQTSQRQPWRTTRVTRVLEPSRRQCRAGFAGWCLCGVRFVLVLRGLTDSVRLTLGLMGLDELHLRVLAASSEDVKERRNAQKGPIFMFLGSR